VSLHDRDVLEVRADVVGSVSKRHDSPSRLIIIIKKYHFSGPLTGTRLAKDNFEVLRWSQFKLCKSESGAMSPVYPGR